jgi:hypothetical protein
MHNQLPRERNRLQPPLVLPHQYPSDNSTLLPPFQQTPHKTAVVPNPAHQPSSPFPRTSRPPWYRTLAVVIGPHSICYLGSPSTRVVFDRPGADQAIGTSRVHQYSTNPPWVSIRQTSTYFARQHRRRLCNRLHELGDNEGSSAPTALPSTPTKCQTDTVQSKICGRSPSGIAAPESYRTTVDAFTGSKGPLNLLSDDEYDSDSSRSQESEDPFSKDYRNCGNYETYYTPSS